MNDVKLAQPILTAGALGEHRFWRVPYPYISELWPWLKQRSPPLGSGILGLGVLVSLLLGGSTLYLGFRWPAG